MALPQTDADRVRFMQALRDYLAAPDMPKLHPKLPRVVKDDEGRFSATLSVAKVTKRKTA